MLYSGDGSSNTGTGKERRDSGSAARGILSDGDLPTDSTLISFLWYFRNTVPMSLNPRPRAGGDGISFRPCNDHLLFQSTPPRRGRLPSGGVAAGPVEVSIHAPAQGATGCLPGGLFHQLVSIHAPAQGATHRQGHHKPRGKVSIHAPAQGATRNLDSRMSSWACFNPRPRAGGDQHAPSGRPRMACFNPRPRAGGDY